MERPSRSSSTWTLIKVSCSAPSGRAAFAYDVGVRSIDEQLRRIEALDSKAGILIAADGVLVGLLVGADSLLARIPKFVAGMGLGGVILSLLIALVAFANREYRLAPSLSASIRFMSASEEWLRWRFLGNLEEAVQANGRRLTWKSRFLTAALVVLFAAVSLLGGYSVHVIVAGV